MTLRTPYDAVRLYLRLSDRLTHPKGIDVGERIRRPAPACPKCGTPKPTQVAPRTRCPNRRCRKPWTWEIAYGHGGRASRYRPPQESTRETQADLGAIFRRVPLWPRRVLFAVVMARQEDGESHEQAVLRSLRSAFPRRVGGWTRDGVRSLQQQAVARVSCDATFKAMSRINGG